MRAEILSIGTELLLGQITDTNAVFLSQRLAELGISLFYRDTVGDNHERLAAVLQLAKERSDLIICTGGLGPTEGRHHLGGYRHRLQCAAGDQRRGEGYAGSLLSAARTTDVGQPTEASDDPPWGTAGAQPDRHRARLYPGERRQDGDRLPPARRMSCIPCGARPWDRISTNNRRR